MLSWRRVACAHACAGELPSEATEALERVGWIDSQGDQDEAAPEFTREDIAYMVQQVCARSLQGVHARERVGVCARALTCIRVCGLFMCACAWLAAVPGCAYTHTHTRTHTPHTHTRTPTHTHTHTHTYTQAHLHTNTQSVCLHVYMYVCMHAYICMFVFMHV